MAGSLTYRIYAFKIISLGLIRWFCSLSRHSWLWEWDKLLNCNFDYGVTIIKTALIKSSALIKSLITAFSSNPRSVLRLNVSGPNKHKQILPEKDSPTGQQCFVILSTLTFERKSMICPFIRNTTLDFIICSYPAYHHWTSSTKCYFVLIQTVYLTHKPVHVERD